MKIKIILLLAVVLLAYGIVNVVNRNFSPDSPPTTALPVATSSKITAQQIQTLLQEANYCTQKNDCVIKSYGCPFGCSTLVNKNHDMSVIEESIRKMSAHRCVYDCDRNPTDVEIACVDNKCIDTRYPEEQ